MLRQILSVTTLSAVVAASLLTATAAKAETFQECIDQAAAQRQQDLANGVDRVTADAWYAASAKICAETHHR
jgi:hypothetical protein